MCVCVCVCVCVRVCVRALRETARARMGLDARVDEGDKRVACVLVQAWVCMTRVALMTKATLALKPR